MSTHARIGIRNQDESVDFIYLHSDGYPSHAGKIFSEHYGSEESARNLIERGTLSSLGSGIGEKHEYIDYDEKVCTFHARDMGRSILIDHAQTVEEFLDKEKYCYLFNHSDGWKLLKPAFYYQDIESAVKEELES